MQATALGETPRQQFLRGLRDGVPIGLGYLSVSFAFGITAVSRGVPGWIALLISMTNLTSAGQLAGLDLMVIGCAMSEMILTQCVINLRYALMSVSLSQKVDETVRLRDRFLIAFGNTDEVFAVASGQPGKVGRYYLFGLIVAPYIGWSSGTLLGTVASGLLPASVMAALGIAIYGMFVAIVIPPARKSRAVALVLGGAVALACAFRYLPVLNRVSGGFVIIICAVIAASLGAIFAPIPEDSEEDATT
ncbi:MAG: AzlC family ABC transporter permease [Clostridia bacterium]|nr:AzlC family ABC transporter permease [Clostridia bacterium]